MTNDVKAATQRQAFEKFHGHRKSKGAANRERMFKTLPDGTYVDDSVQRHWWTWQNAHAAVGAAEHDGPWKRLFWAVANELQCLPSTFVDGNEHVIRKARQFRAQGAGHG